MRAHAKVSVRCRVRIRVKLRVRVRCRVSVRIRVRITSQEALGAELPVVLWSPWRAELRGYGRVPVRLSI